MILVTYHINCTKLSKYKEITAKYTKNLRKGHKALFLFSKKTIRFTIKN
jgi:hypothetical protein